MPAPVPWSRSLLSPSPGLSDYDEPVDMSDFTGGFITLHSANDKLARELDLTQREDKAMVSETPFTIAKLRAHTKSQSSQKRTTNASQTTTLDTATVQPGLKKPTAAASKGSTNWKNNSGWVNADGQPMPHCPPARKGKDKPKEDTASRTKSTSTNAETATVNATTAQTAGGTERKKKTRKEEGKVEFRCLPTNMMPTSAFPILEGFERQKSLPTKASKKRRAPPASPSSTRSSLDLETLIKGAIKPTPEKAKTTSNTKKTTTAFVSRTGLSTRNDKEGPELDVEIKRMPPKIDAVSPAKCLSIEYVMPPASGSAKAASRYMATGSDAHLATPPHSMLVDSFPDVARGRSFTPVRSPQFLLARPEPLRRLTNNVSKLEAMVESGFVVKSTLPVEKSRPSSARDARFQQPSLVLDDTEDHANSNISAGFLPVALPANYMNTHGMASPPSTYGHSMPAMPDLSQASSMTSSFRTNFTEPRHRQSIVNQNENQSYNQNQMNTDSEWSTLSTASRLTLRPNVRPTVIKSSSSFRMPRSVFPRNTRLTPARQPGSQSSSSSGTKLTVWTPTPLKQTTKLDPQCRYVLPSQRVLEQASRLAMNTGPAGPPQENGHASHEDEPQSDDWASAWSRSANVATGRTWDD